MNHKTIILAFFWIVGACVADTPGAFRLALRLLDRIAAVASVDSESGAIALQMLERVAQGRAESFDPTWGSRIGIEVDALTRKGYDDSSVRDYALRKIGECPQAEALAFLEKLQRADFAADSSGQLWPASQIALSDARTKRISEPSRQVDFLRALLASKTATTPTWWTVDQLCNRGAAAALPEIEKSIRRMYSGKSGEDDLAFCKARMDVVSRDPDRVIALRSVFGSFRPLLSSPEGHRLLTWSINQLISMHAASADAELDAFVSHLGDLLKSDPSSMALSELKRQIDTERKWANN